MHAEDIFGGSLSLHPASGATVRRLADLDIETLALMHGPAFTGDCPGRCSTWPTTSTAAPRGRLSRGGPIRPGRARPDAGNLGA